MIYLDSSVALAQLFREPRRPSESFWSQPLASSKLLEYEVWNRVHAYQLTGSHSSEARLLLARVVLIELDEPALARALEPFPIPMLHLATMHFIRDRGEVIEVASYDNRLADAALALGIAIAAL